MEELNNIPQLVEIKREKKDCLSKFPLTACIKTVSITNLKLSGGVVDFGKTDPSVLLSINVCAGIHSIAVFQKEIKPCDVSSRLKK